MKMHRKKEKRKDYGNRNEGSPLFIEKSRAVRERSKTF